MRLLFQMNPQSYEAGKADTEDVAEILEAKYGVMQKFYDSEKEKIAESMTDSLSNILEDAMNGIPQQKNAFGNMENKIEAQFHDFLDAEKISGDGIPTKSAISGYHRFKKNTGRRPSFVDEGLYRNNMQVRVDL